MQPKLASRQVRMMVKKLRRAHYEDANGVLDRLAPDHRAQIIGLLARTGDPRWRERLPHVQTPAPKAPEPTKVAKRPAWLDERLRRSLSPAKDGETFFRITPAAIAALSEAEQKLK